MPENPLLDRRSNTELADSFANFFISKIEKIRENLKHHKLYESTHREVGTRLDKFEPVTESQIKKIVSSLQTKSCELDWCPTQIVKERIDDFAPVLMKLVNASLTDGDFLEEWKLAILRPLLKKLNLELIESNYRPVSNLSFVSKIVEKAMLIQLQDHLESNKLESEHQSAYKKDHSCETSVIKITRKSCCPQQVVFRKPADYSKAAVYKCKVAVYKCKLADYSKAAVYKCEPVDYSKVAVYSKAAVYKCKAAVYKCKAVDYSKAVVYSKAAVYKCKLADYSKAVVYK